MLDDSPHTGAVDDRVTVDQDVAEGDDVTKLGNARRNRRVDSCQSSERLTDDLELSFDG